MPEILRYSDRVKRVEERFRYEYFSGSGDNTITTPVSEGWWIIFHSGLTLPCGPSRPDFTEGQSVRHSIEAH